MHIKQLTIRRSTFYARDFLSQPPMLSFKELDKVYSLICNLCYTNAAVQHQELPLVGGNMRLTPWLKRGGCAHGLLSGSKVLPDYEILGYYETHPRMMYSLTYGSKTQGLLPPSLGSALHYAFRQKAADLADTFMQQLGDGQNLTSREPIYVLREFLLQQRTKDRRIRRGREQKEYGLAAHRVILAWQAIRESKPLSFTALARTDIKRVAEIV